MSKQVFFIGSTVGLLLIIAALFVFSGRTPKLTSTEDISSEQITQTIELEEAPEAPLTAQEVAGHNTDKDCWTIIDDVVYDITEFVANHPGGEIIATICGVDGTVKFKNQGAPQELADSVRKENGQSPDSEFHSPDARNILEKYVLGRLETTTE